MFLAGIVIGAVVNVGAKVVADVISGEFDINNLDWAGYGAALASGALIGGLTAGTGGLNLVAGAAIDAAVTTNC
jgi:cell division protein FtsX